MKIESKKTFLDFDKSSKEFYDILGKKFAGIGKAPANVDLFVFAMAYGFLNGNKVDVTQKSGTGVRIEYIKPEHEQRFEIAEKYAEGGIRLLKNAADQPGDFLQDIAGQMATLYQNIETVQ